MTSPRKPSAAFWITVALLAVLVGYPLSFGPACWGASWTNRGGEHLPTVYQPILSAWDSGPYFLAEALDAYTRLGSKRGWEWTNSRYRWVWRDTLAKPLPTKKPSSNCRFVP